MRKKEATSFPTIIIVLVVAIVIAIGLGFYLGRDKGKQEGKIQAEEKLKPIVDLAFPPPPSEVYSLSGVVKSIYGATINLEIDDPEDYLPHLDGSPRKKQTRSVVAVSDAKVLLIDYTQFDAGGNPKTTELAFKDLKAGDTVTVRSKQNIRDAQKFDATQIELVRY